MLRKSRILQLEHLEQRELLSVNSPSDDFASSALYSSAYGSTSDSITGPTAEEQEMLELINRMRTDPQGELDRLIKNLSPLEAWDSRVTQAIRAFSYPRAANLTSEWAALQACAPLAWDFSLYVAATNHSFRMIQADEQSHQLPGEASLADRIIDAGFDPAMKYNESDGLYYMTASENVYAYGRDAAGEFSAASYTHAAFAIDWGVPFHSHRDNIMNPEFTHVGISMLVETNPATEVGTYITTVDFSAAQTESPNGAYLLGVIFDDYNLSGYYEAGEGISDVQISIQNMDSSLNSPGTAEPLQFSPFQAGGYQIFLENGNYTISVTGPRFQGTVTKYVSIQGENVKVDFTVQDGSSAAPVLDLNGPPEGTHYEMKFLENGATMELLADDATLRDEDNSHLAYAIVTLENRSDAGNEFLCVDTSKTGLSSTYDSTSGILLIFGNASVNDYLSVLKTVEYGNASHKADLSDRVVSFVVSDGVNQSEIAYTTVHVLQQTFETLNIAEVQVEEGDQNFQEMVFHFELSDIPRCDVSIEYAFIDDTAIQGVHYFAQDGTLKIQADQKTASVVVSVAGDYLPGQDLTFYLEIKGIYGAECEQTRIKGTIWDDDTPLDLGSRTSWSVDNLDLTDGRRRLYAFQPEKSGIVFWEAVPSESTGTDFVMEIYKGTHEGEPLLKAYEFNGRERIAWEVEEGETYVILVRGEHVVLDSLKMAYSPFSEGTGTDGSKSLEIQLNPQNNDVITVDLFNDVLWYNGIDMPLQYSDYDAIRFQGVAPHHVLQFIVPEQWYPGGFDVDPDNVLIPGGNSGGGNSGGGGNIDIDDFQHIEYIVTDPKSVVRIQGTDGDDMFDFEDGMARLITSTGRVFTVQNGKIFDVQGNGGNDKAYIFDTRYSDDVRFGSDTVNFLGGGDTGYDISVSGFNVVDVTSLYGGSDKVYVVNENDSSTYLNDRLVRRVEFDAVQNVERNYYARNMSETVLTCTDTTDSTIYLEGGTQPNQVYITPGQLIATDLYRTYYHVIYGNAKIRWIENPTRSNAPVVFYDTPAGVDAPSWFDETSRTTLLIPGDSQGLGIQWTASFATFQNFHFNGVKWNVQPSTPFEAQPEELLENEPIADKEIFYLVEEAIWDEPEEESRDEEVSVPSLSSRNGPVKAGEWYQISLRSLSLVDLALFYGDY